MTDFEGFPSGKGPYIPIPDVFFTRILPSIDDIDELKVTLHLFWLLAQKKGGVRCTNDKELQADRVLLHSLADDGDEYTAVERLRHGLEQAMARGTLLKLSLRTMNMHNSTVEATTNDWYFFNTPRSRQHIELLQGGEVLPGSLFTKDKRHTDEIQQVTVAGVGATRESYQRLDPLPSSHANTDVDHANIFKLYEQNIGLLTPMIAEELKQASKEYPDHWIVDALREAAVYNKRHWSYVRAILRRWETKGRQG